MSDIIQSLPQSVHHAWSDLKAKATEYHPYVYLVLNKNADSRPIKEFFIQEVGDATSLWNGTEYQDWHEIAPVLAQINHKHVFLDWLAQQNDPNFGYVIVSSFDFGVVFQHLQSLTQIYLPDDQVTFFKFWEPTYSFPVFNTVTADELTQLMGPCSAFISTEMLIQHPDAPAFTPHPFPWFKLSPEAHTIISQQYHPS